MIQFTERVLAVAHTAHRAGEGDAVLFIDRKGRGHLQGVLHRSAVHLGSMGDGQVFTDGNVLTKFQAGIDSCGQVLEIGVFQDTLVILVTDGNQYRGTLAHIGQGKVIALQEAGTGNGLEPVCIAVPHGFLRIDITVIQAVHHVAVHLPRGWVISLDGISCAGVQVNPVIGSILNRIQSVIQCGLGHGCCILAAVGQGHHRLPVVGLCR